MLGKMIDFNYEIKESDCVPPLPDSVDESMEELYNLSDKYNMYGVHLYFAQHLLCGGFTPEEAIKKIDKYIDMSVEELGNIVCYQGKRSSEEFMNDINSILV